tara:strand:+ start:8165 stop:8353 length:189 start_codon:yes stop_codon:yes gene_type:complete
MSNAERKEEMVRVTRKMKPCDFLGSNFNVHYKIGAQVESRGFSLDELLVGHLDLIDFIVRAK